jgi:hypothetical protein
VSGLRLHDDEEDQISGGRMTSAADYRKYAEQCIDMAQRGPPEQRQALLKMAEVWLALADTALSMPKTEPGQSAPSSNNLQ